MHGTPAAVPLSRTYHVVWDHLFDAPHRPLEPLRVVASACPPPEQCFIDVSVEHRGGHEMVNPRHHTFHLEPQSVRNSFIHRCFRFRISPHAVRFFYIIFLQFTLRQRLVADVVVGEYPAAGLHERENFGMQFQRLRELSDDERPAGAVVHIDFFPVHRVREAIVLVAQQDSDFVQDVPGGALRHLDFPGELCGGDALFVVDNQVDGLKPLEQFELGVLEDRPDEHGKSTLAVLASVATVLPVIDGGTTAVGADGLAVPSLLGEEVDALPVVGEVPGQGFECPELGQGGVFHFQSFCKNEYFVACKDKIKKCKSKRFEKIFSILIINMLYIYCQLPNTENSLLHPSVFAEFRLPFP